MKLLPAIKRPTISAVWARAASLPMGNKIFSRFVGRMAPYTGTIGATVLELRDGYARVQLKERYIVRNHLNSIHAVALINLGEMTTGLGVLHAIDGKGRGIVTGLRIEYYKKARGVITGISDAEIPTTPGKHDLEVEGELRNTGGDVVAKVWATWKLDIY